MDGFKLAYWKKGSAIRHAADLSTLRVLPWLPATALVLCDYTHHDGKLVEEAPRSVSATADDLLGRKKMASSLPSELEFFLFNNTFHEAFVAGYRPDTVE